MSGNRFRLCQETILLCRATVPTPKKIIIIVQVTIHTSRMEVVTE